MPKQSSDADIVSECWEAFYAAWSIVHCQTLSDSEWIENAKVLTRSAVRPSKDFWEKWPSSPTAFGMYFRVGESALETSIMFTDFVAGELKNACIQRLRKTYAQVIRHRDENDIHEWREACYTNLGPKLIALSAPERFQAKEILWHKIQEEFDRWKGSYQGISRRDIGIAFGHTDHLLSDFVKRFSKAKTNTAESIGKDPLDNRANLFELFPILEDLHKFSPLNNAEKTRLIRHLSQSLRTPIR